MTKKLVAGPFCGEFGWALMSFQAFVRKAAVGYDEVIVCSHEGTEALYKDFAHKFIPHRLAGLKDCLNATNLDMQSLRNIKAYLRTLGGDSFHPTKLIPVEHQHFIPFGSKERGKRLGYNFDMVIHARKPIGKHPGHSWPLQHWNTLVKLLGKYRIAAVGTEAYLPEETVDMRSAGLQDAVDLIAATKLMLGPSSGPMHLASLCKTEHIVWTDNKVYSAVGCTNRARYESFWNPFKTPCTIIDSHGWMPPPELVHQVVEERLSKWNSKPSNQLSNSGLPNTTSAVKGLLAAPVKTTESKQIA